MLARYVFLVAENDTATDLTQMPQLYLHFIFVYIYIYVCLFERERETHKKVTILLQCSKCVSRGSGGVFNIKILLG